jgi:hypothetical protein
MPSDNKVKECQLALFSQSFAFVITCTTSTTIWKSANLPCSVMWAQNPFRSKGFFSSTSGYHLPKFDAL